MPKPRVFLSYRRQDSEQSTRSIYLGFRGAGFNHVFMDTPEIGAGEKWAERIDEELKLAAVVIAVIGPTWLTCQQEDGRRRIDGPDDPVHVELQRALQRRKKIIPVLVDGADPPSPNSLPDDLRELISFQARRLTSENWENDVKALVDSITKGPGELRPTATLVLASMSPRRRRLLQTIGWVAGEDYFPVHVSIPPDGRSENLTLHEAKDLAERAACKKIAWLRDNPNTVNEQVPHGWRMSQTVLIGVDTIVFCRDRIHDRPLLKPLGFAGPEDFQQARERAKEMLEDERGQTVHVITALGVAAMGDRRRPVTRVVTTEARLRSYSDDEIADYISTSEPFDKAGAFGIQERGVAFFEEISGSYTNVVGLPLREFVEMVEDEYGDTFLLPERRSPLAVRASTKSPGATGSGDRVPLSAVCIGDINYDFVYDKLPSGYLSDLAAPGRKIKDAIHRAAGGTAVNFAKGAKAAGFSHCLVVGVVGGDALGQHILNELSELHIDSIYHRDPAMKTSVAVILRDNAAADVSLTLTDAQQSLPPATVNKVLTPIEKSDVAYCSGYCLTDGNRRDSAVEILHAAKRAKCIVVLDVVVGMSEDVPRRQLEGLLRWDGTRPLVDVLVAEIPEVFNWFGVPMRDRTELDLWEGHRGELVPSLRERFPVTILRTRNYTHEIVITPDRLDGPNPLDYGNLPATRKTGYGDARTARQVHGFLSPRIALASGSRQRYELLGQIVAPSKIQALSSTCSEAHRPRESPERRVKRLAAEKARNVFERGDFHGDIELILGADTEIIRQGANGRWDLIGHPTETAETRRDLGRLNNGDHVALTGLAVIGKDPRSECDRLKTVVVCEKTRVTFIHADREQLDAYAETGEGIRRAGAYAIQGLGTLLVKGVKGSYSNVVGLPLERLSRVLADEFDKPIWRFDKVSKWCFPDPIKGLRLPHPGSGPRR
jgi:septum formation protein